MQRQSDNRHWEILQSMAFLFDYHKAKEEAQKTFGHWDQLQEAEYNVGRAFHQLGTSR